MKTNISKTTQRLRRRARIRAKISGTALKPRLSVFKSNKYISAQLINDESGVTLGTAHSKDMKGKSLLEKSVLVGKVVAELAQAKKIEHVVFDRGGFIYTGCVKAVAEGARAGGLTF